MKKQTCKSIVALALTFGLVVPIAPSRAAETASSSGQVLLAQSDGRWSCRNLHGPRRARCEREWRHHDRRDDRKLKDGVALGLFGLAVGAIIAGAAKDAESDRRDEIESRRDWIARCSARYRSFDPRSGTFVGSDGRRYDCR